MEQSNILFSSNLYLLSNGETNDKKFIEKITDHEKLLKLKDSMHLNSFQKRIIEEGSLCKAAQGDPCWGMILRDNKIFWECRCVQKECPKINECRRLELSNDEYMFFSPDIRNTTGKFKYGGVASNKSYKLLSLIKFTLSKRIDNNIVQKQKQSYDIRFLEIDDIKEVENIEATDNIKAEDILEAIDIIKVDNLQSYIDIDIDYMGENSTETDSIINTVGNININKIIHNIKVADIFEADDIILGDDSLSYTENVYMNDNSTGTVNGNNIEIEATVLDELISLEEVKTHNILSEFIILEQQSIIEADSSISFFIDAGPGTGKTYTLITRINYLVHNKQLEADTIQILSFTNAAVNEIRSRLSEFVKQGANRSLRNVDVRTFHSLAWWFIGEANEVLIDKGWRKVMLDKAMDFDTSLVIAANILDKFPEIISEWKCFVVDEIQDINGTKAKFVLALLKACKKQQCSCILLGDSCQAIYDYMDIINKNVCNISSQDFYRMVYQEVEGKAVLGRLQVNYRQSTELINNLGQFRNAILEENYDMMRECVEELIQIYEIKHVEMMNIKNDILNQELSKGNICFMCRNNGQTLRLSSLFRKNDIQHILTTDDNKDDFSSWIAKIFYGYGETFITYDVFSNLIKIKGLKFEGYDIEEIWDEIKRSMKVRGDIINVQELLDEIRTAQIESAIFRNQHEGNIWVSNIHRSKGREFDCVVIDSEFIMSLAKKSKSNKLGEYKTLYVALTRAKLKLMFVPLTEEKLKNRDIYKTGRKRWTSYGKNKLLTHFEIKNDDVKVFAFINDETDKKQEIIKQLQPNTEIVLQRVLGYEKVSYQVIALANSKEYIIGKMDSQFIDDLEALIKPDELIDMPVKIKNLYIDNIYSFIAPKDYETTMLEFKQHSKYLTWNYARFAGIGLLVYDSY